MQTRETRLRRLHLPTDTALDRFMSAHLRLWAKVLPVEWLPRPPLWALAPMLATLWLAFGLVVWASCTGWL